MEKRHPNHPGELSTDASFAHRLRGAGELNARAQAIDRLAEEGVPFLVGGAYAYASYTGIYRDTKDLDLFPRRSDAPRALDVLANDGWRTERTDEVWIYKAFRGEWYVDLIFSSGNGVAEVDDGWFLHARPGRAFGRAVPLVPPEELIWSKAFVMERERYDGSDVNHLLRGVGRSLNWQLLMARFERYWEILLSHLMLFRFSYPGEHDIVPSWVMDELLGRAARSPHEVVLPDRLCRGNLISRVNYQVDLKHWDYLDGRAWDELERRREETRGLGPELESANSGGG
jgi:hypothetical protein